METGETCLTLREVNLILITLKYYNNLSSNLHQHNQTKIDAFFTLKMDGNSTNFVTNVMKNTE